MCPLCDKKCPFWYLNSTCQSSWVRRCHNMPQSHFSFTVFSPLHSYTVSSSNPVCLTMKEQYFLPYSWGFGVSAVLPVVCVARMSLPPLCPRQLVKTFFQMCGRLNNVSVLA